MALMDLRYSQADGLRSGDVVVFRHAGDTYVKRIYATAGDTVTLVRFECGICIFANDDPFIFRKVCRYLRTHPGRGRLERIQVPAGSIYVLGDNRNASIDSRDFGVVSVSDVMGRVLSARRTASSGAARALGSVPPRT